MNQVPPSVLARSTNAPDFASGQPAHAISAAPLLVEIAAGEFSMGENANDKFANDTERPSHRVTFAAPFALGKYPVTVGEFRRFRPGHEPTVPEAWPVAHLSWQDATAYCVWLSGQCSQDFRLPSEAEWEFACRAGTRTPFATGEEITLEAANFLYNEDGLRVGIGDRTPVNSYPPNRLGLHDLHGNVCEWVADSWHPDYAGAPADGCAWVHAGDSRRVIRGGAWDYLPRLLRSSWRDWRPTQYRADNLGFRVATSAINNHPYFTE